MLYYCINVNVILYKKSGFNAVEA